jgi:small multidrug resistance pump
MGYLFLAGAILSEVVATMSLRASDGFSKAPFAVLVVLGYVVAFTLLGLCLARGVPLGVAYGIWCAFGIALVALLSIPLFGETLTPVQIGGMLLIIAGAVALEAGAAHE